VTGVRQLLYAEKSQHIKVCLVHMICICQFRHAVFPDVASGDFSKVEFESDLDAELGRANQTPLNQADGADCSSAPLRPL
jgi:hypothetical protein